MQLYGRPFHAMGRGSRDDRRGASARVLEAQRGLVSTIIGSLALPGSAEAQALMKQHARDLREFTPSPENSPRGQRTGRRRNLYRVAAAGLSPKAAQRGPEAPGRADPP